MSDLFMTPQEVNDNDDTYELIIPSSFQDALSYQQQIIWLYLHKQNKLVEGENITLTENADGTVTISAEGGGSGSTYRIDSVTPDEGYAAAYALIDIATGEQSGETIQIPEAGQGPQGDPGVGISTINGEVGDTGTTVTVTLTDGSTETFFVQRGVAGQDGSPGQPGQDGSDGVSPEVTITSITDGHRVTITDADHPQGQSFDVMDGEDGAPGLNGTDGNGIASITYSRISSYDLYSETPTIESNQTLQANSTHIWGDVTLKVGSSDMTLNKRTNDIRDGIAYHSRLRFDTSGSPYMQFTLSKPLVLKVICDATYMGTTATLDIYNADTNVLVQSITKSDFINYAATTNQLPAGNYKMSLSSGYVYFYGIKSTTSSVNKTRVTITETDGTVTTFDIPDGQDGAPGQDGVTPNISASATVGTNTGTPTVQVTKSGTTAAPEFTFAFDGLKGDQGAAGQNGQDGISPTVTVRTITGGHQIEIVSAGGTERFDVMDGTDGTDGTDGISPTVTVRSITGGHQIEIVSAGGTERFDVMDGTDGSAATIQVGTVTTGQPGTNASVTNSGTSSAAVLDFTIPAGATGSQGPAGPGVPTGGTAGQVLSKIDGTDYNTEWVTPSSGGGGGVEIATDNTHTLRGTTLYVRSSAGTNKAMTLENAVFNFNIMATPIASPAAYASYKLIKPINLGQDVNMSPWDLLHFDLKNTAGESITYAYLNNLVEFNTSGTNTLALMASALPNVDTWQGSIFIANTSLNFAKVGTYSMRFRNPDGRISMYLKMDLSGITLANNESITLYFY